MKKIIALLLVLCFTASLTGCADTIPEELVSETLPEIESVIQELEETISGEDFPDMNFDTLGDIVDRLEEADVKFEETKIDDNNLVVDMKVPDKDSDEGYRPAIPTVDKITPETNPTPKPEEQKPAVPTPETEVTPEPTPEPTPEQLPEPERESELVKPARPTYTYTTGQQHSALSIDNKYLYSLLDEEHKRYYKNIDKAVKNFEKSVQFNINIHENREYMIYFLYMFDNPDVWYLGNTATMYNHGDGTSEIIFCYTDGVEYCTYGHTPSTLTPELKASIQTKDRIFKAEIQHIVSTIPADAPDVVKEKLIYDRILLDSYYDLSAKWNGIGPSEWTAYGILVEKNGVCESYSEAFQTLLHAVGIRCTGVVGTAGGGHKWNAVQLDGEWYMCDITFDDPIGGDPNDAYHYYFNLTSAEMAKDGHDWSNCDWPVPTCNGTKYSYRSYFA